MKQMRLYLIPVLALFLILFGHWHIRQTQGTDLNHPIRTIQSSLLTYEERCANDLGQIIPCRELPELQPGDILITASAHTLFFRHGHMGVVADAKDGLVLEALGLGSRSELLPIERWNDFPTLQILRPKTADPETIKKEALELVGLPYFPLAPRQAGVVQCATLVWQLFDRLGYDLWPEGWILPLTLDASGFEIIYSEGF